MTQGISGSGARRWSVRKPCRAAQVQESSARCLLYRGSGGKRTAGPRRSRGPAGSVPRRSFGSFPIAGTGTRPAGRNPLGAILRLGWGEEDPSSVTACAVTPSPRRGEGFGGGSGSRPYGMPFGLCTPLRHVTGPGMAGRARLLCKGRNHNSGEDLCLPRPGQRLISRFSVRPRR